MDEIGGFVCSLLLGGESVCFYGGEIYFFDDFPFSVIWTNYTYFYIYFH